jgi:hypothetical protein
MRHNRHYHWPGHQHENGLRGWTWRALLILCAAFWITLIRWLLP